MIYFNFTLAHGTYIGSIRIEADKPTQLPINSQFHFGASTRTYIIRERPQSTSVFGPRPIMDQLERESDHASSLLGLPETDLELDVCIEPMELNFHKKFYFIIEFD